MVKAILDEHKTQTRRIIKPQPDSECRKVIYNPSAYEPDRGWYFQGGNMLKCPYGKIGDKLWVRETWAHIDDYLGNDPGANALLSKCFYRADYPRGDNLDDEIKRWKPSIHMPRWASRIDLEITDIRVERVQDISIDDAIAEGIESVDGVTGWYKQYGTKEFEKCHPMTRYPHSSFQTLWDSINVKQGFGWESNPYVWVIEFKNL